MNYESEGHIIQINPEEVFGNFRKRTFWVEIKEKYTQVYEFQVANEKCDLLDSFCVHQLVKVHFNIRGKIWEPKDGRSPKVFTTLSAWRIQNLMHPEDLAQLQKEQAIDSVNSSDYDQVNQGHINDEDIPF